MVLRAFRLLVPLIPLTLGCSGIAGLNDLEEVDCVTDCGAGGGKGGTAGAAGVAGASGGAGKSGGAGTGGAGGAGAGGAAGKGGQSGAGGLGGQGGQGGAAGKGGAVGIAGQGGAAGKGGQGGIAGQGGAAGKGGQGGAGTGGSGGKGGQGGGGQGGAIAGTGGGGSSGQGGAGVGGADMGGSGGIAGSGGNGGMGGACTPTITCLSQGKNCGTIADDCGNPLDCGQCAAPLNCGDAGRENLCGCKPGTFSCSGADGSELRKCSADGSASYPVETCATGTCNADMGTCGGCTPGSLFCVGQQLNSCDGAGNPSPKGAPCGAATICNPSGAGSCDKCIPGSYSCVGANLKQCNATGTGSVSKATCDSSVLCARSIFLGYCAKPVCNPKDVRCSGNLAQVCNAQQDGWDLMDACASAALCMNGACLPPTCAEGEKRCTDNNFEICNKDRNGFDSTPCAAPTAICENSQCINRGPTMVLIQDNAAPVPYYVDSTEVTRSQYNDFLATNPPLQSDTLDPPFCDFNTNYGLPSATLPNQPATQVDWCDAYAYCKWAGKRLCGKIGGGKVDPSNMMQNLSDPAQDQWYLACTGPARTAFPYGDAYVGNACNGKEFMAQPAAIDVGSDLQCEGGFPGVLDMSGNVAEWEDSCSGDLGKGDTCRTRGGAFTSAEAALRCDSVGTVLRNVSASKNIGFRCCAD
jgi:hypothetical protein